MTFFLFLNNKDFKEESKVFYGELFARLFSEQKALVDFPDFSSTDYATYNLSIIIADSGALSISYENLKSRVLAFLESAVEEVKDEETEKVQH